MSAADRLKALVEGFFEDMDPYGWEAPEEVIRALPEIIAVVEAAEAWADDSADLGSIEAGEVPSNSEILHFALVALDGKLGQA